jgi:bidirectional [NiFe] hydrogenase diaphorase subunit
MVTLTINGKMVKAEQGEMLLKVIRREKIEIPAPCHHDAVEPYGACRMCTVEITHKDWKGWKGQVTSCLYPVEDGLIVSTHTPEVIALRKTILDLYLARSPQSEVVRGWAEEYGITQTSFEVVPDGNDCILCGLCTRVCDQMGFHAISAANRGHGKEIAPPLWEAPAACVGCLSCANVCPTNYIKYTDKNGTREIWGKKFELIRCEKSGLPTITKEFAEYLSKHRNIPAEYYTLGDRAHRTETAMTFGKISHWQKEG